MDSWGGPDEVTVIPRPRPSLPEQPPDDTSAEPASPAPSVEDRTRQEGVGTDGADPDRATTSDPGDPEDGEPQAGEQEAGEQEAGEQKAGEQEAGEQAGEPAAGDTEIPTPRSPVAEPECLVDRNAAKSDLAGPVDVADTADTKTAGVDRAGHGDNRCGHVRHRSPCGHDCGHVRRARRGGPAPRPDLDPAHRRPPTPAPRPDHGGDRLLGPRPLPGCADGVRRASLCGHTGAGPAPDARGGRPAPWWCRRLRRNCPAAGRRSSRSSRVVAYYGSPGGVPARRPR